MTRIKECLDRIGQTQKWLALTMGIKQPSVHDWVTGKNMPSAENLKRLSEIFNVSTDYLLGIDQEEKQKEAPTGEALDNKLIEMLTSLTPDQVQRVMDFVAGMKATNKE